MRTFPAALLSLVLCVVPIAAFTTEVDLGDLHLDASAELRSLFTFTRAVDAERLFVQGSTRRRDSGLSLTRLRVQGGAAYKERLYGQVVDPGCMTSRPCVIFHSTGPL